MPSICISLSLKALVIHSINEYDRDPSINSFSVASSATPKARRHWQAYQLPNQLQSYNNFQCDDSGYPYRQNIGTAGATGQGRSRELGRMRQETENPGTVMCICQLGF